EGCQIGRDGRLALVRYRGYDTDYSGAIREPAGTDQGFQVAKCLCETRVRSIKSKFLYRHPVCCTEPTRSLPPPPDHRQNNTRQVGNLLNPLRATKHASEPFSPYGCARTQKKA